ncbi:MAG: DNA repair protein RadA [Gammaproteobacteria bacterium]|nr:DNA repair protein RadA [Gammaproteobacteria bacterium]
MAKPKTAYVCEACGAQSPKWQGQCADCGAWNTLVEARPDAARQRAQRAQYAGRVELARLDELAPSRIERRSSGFGELDRVLGGGLVPGSVVLLGGDPGIGKSTLLLKALASLAAEEPACYVTGEESLDQIALRARRLGVADAPIQLLAETCVDAVLAQLERSPPAALVIDSIQTLYTEALESAPGSVSQLRECTAQLVRFAKTHNVATLLVGHVTKEGTIAGPRVLEHMVDAVLYFESDVGSRYRIIRAVKNRFGAANELGFFVMAEEGFREVKNPSAIFLARRSEPVPGSVTLVTREGSRPLLVEVQALVDQSLGTHPRRLAQGFDPGRLGLLLAVLHRHCGIHVGDCDVYANIVGGLRVTETASDLAIVLAVLSSFRERPLPERLAVFGEVGLTGEIRPVPFGEERVIEAEKHGFDRLLVPRANRPRREGRAEVIAVEKLIDAVDALFG